MGIESNKAFTFREYTPDLTLTAEQVLALPIGSRVAICGKDSNGEYRETVCIVSGHYSRKFLTYREHGTLKKCAIRDYPEKYYKKVI